MAKERLINFLLRGLNVLILHLNLVSAEGLSSANVFKRIGWLTVPKAFIGFIRQIQALANPTGQPAARGHHRQRRASMRHGPIVISATASPVSWPTR
jgi:hypothetical protein